MKSTYLVVGSLFALTVGIGAALGINSYLSAQSELASMKAVEAAQAASTAQPTQTAQATQATAPTVTQPAPAENFESLALCDQIDAIAKSGKSVAQFIADSGRYSEFEANIEANCNWNAEQLEQAYAILNPPVITIQPRVVVLDSPQPAPPKPQPVPGKPWNNCNGIPEPGETYSAACDAAQTHNDSHPDPHHHDPIDHRPIDPKTGERIDPDLPFDPHTGKNTGVKGYYMPDVDQPPAPTSEVNETSEPQVVESNSDSAES